MSAPSLLPQVDLRFERRPGGVTFLARQRAGYPFHVGRVLKRSDAPPTAACVLLQSSAGGLFEHDRVAVQLKVCSDAGARVGNAAATVVHSMTGGSAHSKVSIDVEPHAWLEYMPELSILFPHAHLVVETDVVLHPGALVMLTDSFLAHDPDAKASGFDFFDTCLTVRTEDGRLLMRDRVRIDGALWATPNAGVSATYCAQASFFVLHRTVEQDLVSILQAAIRDHAGAYIGFGALPNQCGVFVRVLAHSGQTLRTVLALATLAMRQTFPMTQLVVRHPETVS